MIAFEKRLFILTYGWRFDQRQSAPMAAAHSLDCDYSRVALKSLDYCRQHRSADCRARYSPLGCVDIVGHVNWDVTVAPESIQKIVVFLFIVKKKKYEWDAI